jgi:serine protease Do
MGVTIQDLNQSLAGSFGLKRPDGALVASVAPDSPAAKAGLQPGDVITEVNGEPVTSSGSLSSRIGLMTPGQTAHLKVWRDKESRDVAVNLTNAEDVTQTAEAGSGNAEQGHLGLALRALTRDERSQAHVDHGLVVENATGPAARAGITEGDVVLAINGKPVNTLNDVKKVLDGKPKSVALLVDRDGNRIFVPVSLG